MQQYACCAHRFHLCLKEKLKIARSNHIWFVEQKLSPNIMELLRVVVGMIYGLMSKSKSVDPLQSPTATCSWIIHALVENVQTLISTL